MNLTAEAFKEIVETIRSEIPSEGDENRKESRANVGGSATIIPCGDAIDREPINIVVQDLSPIGICVRHKKPIHSGKKFILFLAARAGKSRGILCRVTRWQPVGQDLYDIGAIFEQDLAVDAPQAKDLAAKDIRRLEKRLANSVN